VIPVSLDFQATLVILAQPVPQGRKVNLDFQATLVIPAPQVPQDRRDLWDQQGLLLLGLLLERA